MKKLIIAYCVALIVFFGVRYLIYGQLMPNTYYLKMDYVLSDRLLRAVNCLNWQFLVFLWTPKKYIIPVALLLAYNFYIGGDSWEQYEFFNRFLILSLLFVFETESFKEIWIAKLFLKQ